MVVVYLCSNTHTHTHACKRTFVHIATSSVSATTLITGHELSVQEWNVRCDLQPKCQCCAVVSGVKETERQSSEIESQCVRKSRGKRFLCMSGRRKGSRGRRRQGGREGGRDRRRVCSCAIVTNSRLLFILACGSQQPHTSGVRLAGERRGKGEERVLMGWQRQNIPLSKRRICAFLLPAPSNPASSCSSTLSL